MTAGFDPIRPLADLAVQHRTAVIGYQKPTERAPTDRHVEAYRLEATAHGTSVVCWQLAPKPEGGRGWRAFRTDRILSVRDGGKNFHPRSRLTLSAADLADQGPAVLRLSPVPDGDPHAYHAMLDRVLIGGAVEPDDMERLEEAAASLDADVLRVIHAHVYAGLLQEVLLDGRITQAEEHCLTEARSLLDALGWAP